MVLVVMCVGGIHLKHIYEITKIVMTILNLSQIVSKHNADRSFLILYRSHDGAELYYASLLK